jgi:hypothetical protein
MHISALFIYPVKSLRGLSVPFADVDSLGFRGDRRFLVVDEGGRFLTQRSLPRMALIATALDATHLTLSVGPDVSIRVAGAPDPTAPLRPVSIWKSENLLAEDCGEPVAAFLSEFLGIRCRLVRIGTAFSRPILKAVARPGETFTFADAFPLLVIGEASLGDLNDRLAAQGDEALPMNRFRPNLVVTGCPAFAEDTWMRFQAGNVVFRAGGPCIRCIMTTTNQDTGARDGAEPLRTLATYRRDEHAPAEVKFGQNLLHETKSGTVRVGDRLVFP